MNRIDSDIEGFFVVEKVQSSAGLVVVEVVVAEQELPC